MIFFDNYYKNTVILNGPSYTIEEREKQKPIDKKVKM